LGWFGRRRATPSQKPVFKKIKKMKNKLERKNTKACQKSKQAYKDFKSRLKGATFKIKSIPKVMVVLKPILLKQMAKMKAKRGKGGKAKAPAIPDIKTLKEFMSMKLHKLIGPPIMKMFAFMEKMLWKVVMIPLNIVKAFLMAAVGAIPFVGGVMAAVVSNVFSQAIAMLKTAVNKKLNALGKVLENKAVGIALKLMFKVVNAVAKKMAPALKFVKRSAATLKAAQKAGAAKFNKHLKSAYTKEHKKAKKVAPHPAQLVKLAVKHATTRP